MTRRTSGVDIPLLHRAGRGRWVGIFADLGSVKTTSRQYLEGDERVFLDGSKHPNPHGTGTEDIFNGGFYFDQGSFSSPLHGSPYHWRKGGEDVTAAYRWFLTDGIPWDHAIQAGLEGGPTSNLELRVRTVAYHYSRPEPGLWLWDVLDLGDGDSRSRHAWSVDGDSSLESLDSLFEGEPPESLQAAGVYRPPGTAQARFAIPEGATRVRVRRRLDAGFGGQRADLWVAGRAGGRPSHRSRRIPIGAGGSRISIYLHWPSPNPVLWSWRLLPCRTRIWRGRSRCSRNFVTKSGPTSTLPFLLTDSTAGDLAAWSVTIGREPKSTPASH